VHPFREAEVTDSSKRSGCSAVIDIAQRREGSKVKNLTEAEALTQAKKSTETDIVGGGQVLNFGITSSNSANADGKAAWEHFVDPSRLTSVLALHDEVSSLLASYTEAVATGRSPDSILTDDKIDAILFVKAVLEKDQDGTRKWNGEAPNELFEAATRDGLLNQFADTLGTDAIKPIFELVFRAIQAVRGPHNRFVDDLTEDIIEKLEKLSFLAAENT
jgi:hypothetical protein